MPAKKIGTQLKIKTNEVRISYYVDENDVKKKNRMKAKVKTWENEKENNYLLNYHIINSLSHRVSIGFCSFINSNIRY